jgi:hypothetical protein
MIPGASSLSRGQLATAQARTAALRKNAHGRDINHLLSQARSWRHDGVSVKSLQKNYGRSVLARAPGYFMSELKRKAERAGGKSLAQSARELKTSQYCHVRAAFTKKTLSERWHVFPDGSAVQRDVYSAFLARNAQEKVDEDGVVGWAHDPSVLLAAFARLAPALRAQGLYRSSKSLLDDGVAGKHPPQRAPSSKSSSRESRAMPRSGQHDPLSALALDVPVPHTV